MSLTLKRSQVGKAYRLRARPTSLETAPAMPAFARPAALYFAIVFAAAFVLGLLRVALLAPRMGELAAVALELPFVLGLSWIVAGVVLRRRPLPGGQRLAMGATAFALLMLAELGLALLLGQTAEQFFRAMGTPAGMLGLAGQIGFAVIPALRG